MDRVIPESMPGSEIVVVRDASDKITKPTGSNSCSKHKMSSFHYPQYTVHGVLYLVQATSCMVVELTQRTNMYVGAFPVCTWG